MAAKTGLNHLSTDKKAAAEVAIPVVDAGGTSPTSSVTGSVPSFQEFLDYKLYCEELDVGFLNVLVGVDCFQVGLDLLGPVQKSYRDALTTGTGTGPKKTFPTGTSVKLLCVIIC